MGWCGGWKKIYLFYGVIFFLLGGAGVYLRVPDGQHQFSRVLQRLAADWRGYLITVPDQASPAVTVIAPTTAVTVMFFYPEQWAQQFPSEVQKLSGLLNGHFARVEMRTVDSKVDFAAWFAARVVKYPDRIIAGLEPARVGERDSMAHLWWRTLTVPPLTRLAANLEFLPLPVQIEVKLRPGSGFCSEISWEEPGQDGETNLGSVMAVWAETLNVAENPGEKQPL